MYDMQKIIDCIDEGIKRGKENARLSSEHLSNEIQDIVGGEMNININTFRTPSKEAKRVVRFCAILLIVIFILLMMLLYEAGPMLALLPAVTGIHGSYTKSKSDAIKLLMNLETELDKSFPCDDIDIAMTAIRRARGLITCNNIPDAIQILILAQDRLSDAQIKTRINIQDAIEMLQKSLGEK